MKKEININRKIINILRSKENIAWQYETEIYVPI